MMTSLVTQYSTYKSMIKIKESKKKPSDTVKEGNEVLWEHEGNHFVTSYVRGTYAHETMMFPSDKEGAISDFGDLACVRDKEAHQECVDIYLAHL